VSFLAGQIWLRGFQATTLSSVQATSQVKGSTGACLQSLATTVFASVFNPTSYTLRRSLYTCSMDKIASPSSGIWHCWASFETRQWTLDRAYCIATKPLLQNNAFPSFWSIMSIKRSSTFLDVTGTYEVIDFWKSNNETAVQFNKIASSDDG